MGKPVSNWSLGTALKCNLDEPGKMAVQAAQEMDRVGHVTAGIPVAAVKQRGKMRMACRTRAGDARKLGRGNADR